ncbi:MAG TPA: DUF4956 domain-containing protein [Gemmatimonadaceae bacterium]|nr:DUF4956 domain-containing protein [Gemmatimonadaceae bacterium]
MDRAGGDMSDWRRSPFVSNVLLRTATFYLLAGATAWALREYTPTAWGMLGAESDNLVPLTARASRGAAAAVAGEAGEAPWLPAVVAMLTAFATSLPVAWIYTLTRHKKGYQQSVVQTLLILPLTVAGIVVLVKHSVALAFSLGGIVAAVRFRTTLDDTKDAANVFVVTGIGMAAAVAPPVSWVLSVTYNALAVFLWQSDFGRMPAALEGKRAEKSLERALAVANRTGMFVARLDDEVLDHLAPDQLEAVAERAWRRRKRAAPELGDDARTLPDYLLRLRCADVDAARAACEPQFDGLFSRWKFLGKAKENGTRVVEYAVAPLDSVTPGVIKELLRGTPGAGVTEVELRQ